MTPNELIETAQYLNPEKLEHDPAAALQDALAYSEALRILASRKKENQPAPNPAPDPLGKPDPTLSSAELDQLPTFTKAGELVRRLKAYCNKKRLSVYQLGPMIGIKPASLYHWFNSKYRPGETNVKKIAKFLEQHQ
jgi:Helix-turn-helix